MELRVAFMLCSITFVICEICKVKRCVHIFILIKAGMSHSCVHWQIYSAPGSFHPAFHLLRLTLSLLQG